MMSRPSPDLIIDAQKHQQLNEKRLSHVELFRRLKKNKDGRLDFDQLIGQLKHHGVEGSDKKRSDTVRVSFLFFIVQAKESMDISFFFSL